MLQTEVKEIGCSMVLECRLPGHHNEQQCVLCSKMKICNIVGTGNKSK